MLDGGKIAWQFFRILCSWAGEAVIKKLEDFVGGYPTWTKPHLVLSSPLAKLTSEIMSDHDARFFNFLIIFLGAKPDAYVGLLWSFTLYVFGITFFNVMIIAPGYMEVSYLLSGYYDFFDRFLPLGLYLLKLIYLMGISI